MSQPPRRSSWRLLAPLVLVLAGLLFVTSAVSSGGTDLRAGRYDDLDGLANSERQDLQNLRARAAGLTQQVNALTAALAKKNGRHAQQRLLHMRHEAGLSPVQGPALTVTLTDAPAAVQNSTLPNNVTADELLVHQQDIQAVANAMWAGGAEAMTIQGQRVVSTTGIKCVGNTVVLHDVPYSPPYVITAIGPVDKMMASLDASRHIRIYLQFVDRFQLGWDESVQQHVTMPGYAGPVDLSYAHTSPPATNSRVTK